jgi:hypothetical protein
MTVVLPDSPVRAGGFGRQIGNWVIHFRVGVGRILDRGLHAQSAAITHGALGLLPRPGVSCCSLCLNGDDSLHHWGNCPVAALRTTIALPTPAHRYRHCWRTQPAFDPAHVDDGFAVVVLPWHYPQCLLLTQPYSEFANFSPLSSNCTLC